MPDDVVADAMSDAAPSQHSVFRGIGRFIGRIYSLALIVVVSYLTYLSIDYLVSALITPSQAPPQVRSIPRRMDAQTLHGSRRDWLGLEAVEGSRTPPSHYHRIDAWIAPDSFNNCTQSGCHSPLPHAEDKSTRAFLNMHATSMHCGVCHMKSEDKPLDLTWYSLADGRASEPPSALRAYDWLSRNGTAEARRKCGKPERDLIADLLRQAAIGADGDPTLTRVAQHLRATRPGGEEFSRMLDIATDAVVRSFRGAYGVKLALRGQGGGPILAHPGTAESVKRYLAAPLAKGAPNRAAALAAIHPLRRDIPRTCGDCHNGDGLVDFERLGYPADRVASLRGAAIYSMIEHISTGEPFDYPTSTDTSQP
ncbi:MAG: hypothetical protein KDA32_05210 [Phycisphaerales bacterium]|nr:hypothetical protein [Phycisphaerales bacterium]